MSHKDESTSYKFNRSTVTRPCPARLVTIFELARTLGCSTRHIRRLVARGEFPPPIRIGTLIRWPIGAVEAWVDARQDEARNGGAR